MTDKKGVILPPQGDRTPRGRREGGIVPAPLPSSSDDGQGPSGLPKKRKKMNGGGEKEKVGEKRERSMERTAEMGVKSSKMLVLEEGIRFEDGKIIKWDDVDVSPIYERVFVQLGAAAKWTPGKRKYLSQCLSILSWERFCEEFNKAMFGFQGRAVEENSIQWQVSTIFISAMFEEVERRFRLLKEETLQGVKEDLKQEFITEFNNMVSGMRPIVPTTDAGTQGSLPTVEETELRREMEVLRGRPADRPHTMEVGIQAAPPVSGGVGLVGMGGKGSWTHPPTYSVGIQTDPPPQGVERPEQEAGSPLGGVLSEILARLDALERGMKGGLLRRPATYAQAVGVRVAEGGGRPSGSPAVTGPVGAVPRPPVQGKDGGRRRKGKRKAAAPSGATRVGQVVPQPPASAAVTITIPPGAGITYAEALASAKRSVSLKETGVPSPSLRRARTGGLVVEIPGPGGDEGADRLADRLTKELGPLGVRIARPLMTADLRLRGLDLSVTPQEVASAIAEVGGCEAGRVRVGAIRSSPGSASSCWLRCPAVAAAKVAKAGRLMVGGWFAAAVEPLKPRPLRCHRCLEVGHPQALCTSAVDRRDRCYRCGGSGHVASGCSASPRCPLCADGVGLDSAHVLGGRGCSPRLPRGEGSSSSPPPVAMDCDPAEPSHRKVGRRKEGESLTPPLLA